MKVSVALKIFRDYQSANLKPRTVLGYRYILTGFEEFFGERDLGSVTGEDIYHFLEMVTEGNSNSSKRHRYSQLKAFFNFIITNYVMDHRNPLDTPLMRKTFRKAKAKPQKAIPKEIIDELIFNCQNLRDRLLLELQSRCGARIGEVLGILVKNIEGRRITVRNPKSGKENEIIFMPEQVANRLMTYIREKSLKDEDRVFNLSYTSARAMIKRMGERMGLVLNPHDLRRHSATFASRNGMPLEIISKVILRHQNLKTTQLYLGKVSDSEAIRWMDTLHGD